MSKLKQLLLELRELDKVELKVINRVWDEASQAVDMSNTELTQENIKKRAEELAKQITVDFPQGNPVLVGLMDGAVPFAALLCEALQKLGYPFNYTTMTVSSYGNQMVSGAMKMGELPKANLIGQDVIVLDDVCDTGKTLKAVRDKILTQCPSSIKLMTLVDKVQPRPDGCDADYVGFKLPKTAFIIGMGLDYRRSLRDKTSIRVANETSLPNGEEKALLERRNQVLREIREIIDAKELAKSQLVSPGINSIFNPDNQTKTGKVEEKLEHTEAVNPFEMS